MAPNGRKPRARTSHVDEGSLQAAWEEYTRLSDPGFAFDGSSYGKPLRSLCGDLQGLSQHAKPLGDLLTLAPSGFPSQGNARQVLLALHTKYKMLKCPEQHMCKEANTASGI